MEDQTFFLFLLLSCLFAFIYTFTNIRRRHSRLPPGPYPFPIIGNLLKVGNNPHRSLAILSKQYGPLMSLKLGSKTTIVLSSPEIAKEFFHTHDISFSSRSVPDTVRAADHHKFSMVWLPAGDQWRKLRKITKEYMFSVQQLDASELLRQEKVQEFLNHVNRCCTNEEVVNIGAAAFTTTLNILSNFMFSRDFAQYDSMSSQEFKDAVCGLMKLGGKPNLPDFFPILKSLDLQGLRREGTVYANKLLSIFDKVINERLQSRSTSSSHNGDSTTKKDVLDLLLNLNQNDESEFSLNDIRHLFLALFIAGTDTTSITLEWVMSELIRNPEKMEIARFEVMKHMQNNKRSIQESDISQLTYLQAVIKETLRLHPPGPFLIPHQAINDIEIKGYMVPKNAQILCNIWAMGQDPNIWLDPQVFRPERFLDVEIDYKGHNFELIPFGTGRRICPGLNLANRMLHVMLSSLIHKFDWKVVGYTRPQDIDMGEKFGITLQKTIPLMAIPVKR
ncbi:unnamed protein product [Lactuca saligna]|uniref:Cytochrome P450 n=1 Tax=Lactuca saligna TaxID=75948 RepID=A0AA35ZXI2_LACSI|nr:unnamed protein product [Lactuca saligna]